MMKAGETDIVAARAVRRSLVESSDIEGDVKFQNDINNLLARMDEKVPPITSLGWMMTQPPEARARARQRKVVAQRVLRVLDGGGGVSEALRQAAAAGGASAGRGAPPTPTPVMTSSTTSMATGADGQKVLVEWPAAVRQGHR
jgi:hypothetical protein